MRMALGAWGLAVLIGMLPARADEGWARVAVYRLGDDPAVVQALFTRVDEASGADDVKAIEAGLIEALGHPEATDDGRALAARMLAQVGSERSVPALAGMLADEPLSTYARLALERIGGPVSVSALRAALVDASETVAKAGLIGSLASLGDRVSVSAIADLADDPALVPFSLRALGRIGGTEALDALEGMTVSDAWETARRRALIEAARSLPPKAVLPVFRRLAGDEDPGIAGAALSALADAAPDEGAERMIEALAGPGEAAIRIALSVLAEGFGGTALVSRLAGRLDAVPEAVRPRVLVVLGHRDDPAALPLARAGLQADDAAARGVAIEVVARLGGADMVPALLEVNDRRVLDALARMDGEGIDARLIAALDQPEQRTLAVEVLARRGVRAAVPRFLEILAGSDTEGFTEIWQALRSLAGDEHAKTMVPLVFKADSAEQGAALAALRSLVARTEPGSAVFNEVVPHFATVPESGKDFILDLAAVAATPAALTLVEDVLEDPALRGRALRALAAWRTGIAVPRLLTLAAEGSDESERLIALRGALRTVSGPGPSESERAVYLIEAAGHISRPEEKRLLLAAVSSSRDPRLAPIIGEWFGDSDVREEAELAARDLVWNLRANASPALRELASKMLESPTEETVKMARQVIDFWKQQ